jgi:hypothetical protein
LWQERIMKNDSTLHFSRKQLCLIAALLAVPLLVMAGKLPCLPFAKFFWTHFSLLDLPAKMQNHVEHIAFVPLGATLVVFFRLTLGVRVLGPFRSILLAFAFAATGILLGLVFLAVTITIVVAIGPLIKGMRLPYFGRISAMLSTVALLIVLGILSGTWLDFHALHKVAYFPLVVLCLIGEAFVRTASREGPRSALWRSLMTALLAVLLTFLAGIPALQGLLLRFPEVLSAQTACILLIAKYCTWRWLEWLNPKVGIDEDEDKDEDDFWIAKHTPRKQVKRPASLARSDRATGDRQVSLPRGNLERGELTHEGCGGL